MRKRGSKLNTQGTGIDRAIRPSGEPYNASGEAAGESGRGRDRAVETVRDVMVPAATGGGARQVAAPDRWRRMTKRQRRRGEPEFGLLTLVDAGEGDGARASAARVAAGSGG
ncbi:hypothetical protein GCM10023322_78330 [Rugosimonospora acidiphila]|uniref:Uncharacterized protein n=1 Tax=Rugosimonospora acidiphila TaxID=556531 RepID=A0ABP9SPV8_9ACTN